MQPIEEFRYLVLATQREGARALAAALRDHDLTPSQAEAIAVVRDARRPLTVREIGQRLVCESGSPSRLTATLTRRGLFARQVDSRDRRATRLSLTEDGVRAAHDVAQVEQQLYAALASVLDPDQVSDAAAVLRALVAELPAGRALRQRVADTRQPD